MPQPPASGIQIAEIPASGQPIPLPAGCVTAFVGRTLKGPVNVPVPVGSPAEFQQVFGGLWQPSPLSYAIEQYFEHGGTRAVVVRVVNGAMPSTLSLPCGGHVLTLVALAPGTREYLRAAVDYDNIGDNEEDRFNLVVQRLRDRDSERIEAQETYRGITVLPGDPRHVATVLEESQLVRVRGRVPDRRPDATGQPGAFAAGPGRGGYVPSNPDGSDGGPVTDYDVIGSRTLQSGLFALDAVEPLDFVYIPPLSRDTDIGPSSLVVASRYCTARRAVLVVDPPKSWVTVDEAIRGLRELNFSSPDACMFFPRLVAPDRLRGGSQVFGNGGAVAGMLSRAEMQRPLWQQAAPEPDLLLRPGIRPAATLSVPDRWRLAANGINALQAVRSAGPVKLVPRTLAGGSHAAADFGYIGARRLALAILSSIERGTRWMVTEPSRPALWQQARRQVEAFLAALSGAGAFPGAPPGRAFFVITDERVNGETDVILGRVHVLFGFASSRPDEYHSYLVTHSTSGSAVRPVAANPVLGLLARRPHSAPAVDDDLSQVGARSGGAG